MTASGRAVLVTGASRGIGASVARAFAAGGDRVALHYGTRREQALGVSAELPGDGHVVVGADLADPEAVQAMVAEVAAALGGIDVLVNNAGVIEPHPITGSSYAEWQQAWRRTLDVNLVGAANVTWCALQHMGRGARIVNVSSRGAFRGEPASRSPRSRPVSRRPTWPRRRWLATKARAAARPSLRPARGPSPRRRRPRGARMPVRVAASCVFDPVSTTRRGGSGRASSASRSSSWARWLIRKVVSKPSAVCVAPETTCRPAFNATASIAGSTSAASRTLSRRSRSNTTGSPPTSPAVARTASGERPATRTWPRGLPPPEQRPVQGLESHR